MKLDDEGYLRFEVVENKDMAIECSMVMEFNEASSEENGGHSRSYKG